jgi:hypothetical protein
VPLHDERSKLAAGGVIARHPDRVIVINRIGMGGMMDEDRPASLASGGPVPRLSRCWTASDFRTAEEVGVLDGGKASGGRIVRS